MAQNVTIAGASYSNVPSIVVPKTGSGTASFFDVSDTTAVAADVLSGKYFYTAAGVKTAGTGSGVSAYAYIVAEYPSGSTATCTNIDGAIDLSTTMKLFLVSDNATSCVVTSSSITETATKTVSITAGQSYYVELEYDYYFVKNGVEWNNTVFTSLSKGYNNSEASSGTSTTIGHQSGYVEIRGVRPSSSRRGTVCKTQAVNSIIANYRYLIVHGQRYCSDGGTSQAYHFKTGTFDTTKNTYSVSCFPDSNTVTNNLNQWYKQDPAPVYYQIPITNLSTDYSTSQTDLNIAFAFVVSSSASGLSGIDLYDMYLTNTPLPT